MLIRRLLLDDSGKSAVTCHRDFNAVAVLHGVGALHVVQGLVTGIFPVFEGCHGEGAALGQEVERYFQVAAGAVGDGAKEPSVAFLLGYNLILSGFGSRAREGSAKACR